MQLGEVEKPFLLASMSFCENLVEYQPARDEREILRSAGSVLWDIMDAHLMNADLACFAGGSG